MQTNRTVGLTAITVVFTLILAGCSVFEDPDGGKCRDLMAERLSAPGSAKFGPTKVEMTGNGTKLVTGWVDAENGFGALLRQDFYCESSNGEVTLTYP